MFSADSVLAFVRWFVCGVDVSVFGLARDMRDVCVFPPGGVWFWAVAAESAQGASSDSAVMSQCSAGEEPPALVASPQGSPSSKSRSSCTTWAPSI